MKAIVLTRYGSPDLLQLKEVENPLPKDDEVLVKVHAAAVNDWDWSFVRGKPYLYRLMFGLFRPKMSVLGAELAGTIEATGHRATRFQPGDEVYGDISEAGLGSFAEYVCVKEEALIPKPPGMTFEQATTIPHASALALQGLVDVGKIQKNENILINGAGGGVGIIAVQIAKQFGAKLTGVDSASKLDMLKSVGFDYVIDYKKEDFTGNGQSYDLILDTKTNRSAFSYLRSLKPGGRYVTVGGHLPRLLQIFCMGGLIRRITGKSLQIVALKPNKNLDYINTMFETSGIKSVIDGPYPLSEVPQAIQRFGEARHLGKVVITLKS